MKDVKIDGLDITDQGIQSLRQLTHLQRLYVGCGAVTADGMNKLKASLKAEYVLE